MGATPSYGHLKVMNKTKYVSMHSKCCALRIRYLRVSGKFFVEFDKYDATDMSLINKVPICTCALSLDKRDIIISVN